MNPFERSADRRRKQQGKRDNPEGVPTEKESLFDKFASERTVDPIPVEDQTISSRTRRRKTARNGIPPANASIVQEFDRTRYPEQFSYCGDKSGLSP
ncbi:hypothetical protein [Paenibacillus glycanilyticus]|uniref:hypothetical protein n=1 Tax=Paenibacillus glycanilyticus TaxID=126569 RepID=UPI003EC07EB1